MENSPLLSRYETQKRDIISPEKTIHNLFRASLSSDLKHPLQTPLDCHIAGLLPVLANLLPELIFRIKEPFDVEIISRNAQMYPRLSRKVTIEIDGRKMGHG